MAYTVICSSCHAVIKGANESINISRFSDGTIEVRVSGQSYKYCPYCGEGLKAGEA